MSRVGVFICHCGTNIAGKIEIEELISFASSLPEVKFTHSLLYSCAEDGLNFIQQKIKEYNLTHVVVASCTPRTHEEVFRTACERGGLNRYLFELVNIREHCSWVHPRNKEKATQKAKELIAMGVAKVKLLSPREVRYLPVQKKCAIIGGGVAGLTLASNLGRQGVEVYLIEKENTLGGRIKKVGEMFNQNMKGKEFVEKIVKEVEKQPKIRIMVKREVEEVEGFIGNFKIKLNKGEIIEVGVVVLACGGEELKPKGEYGYGKWGWVITQGEFEEYREEEIKSLNQVVIINCVGAKGSKVNYCGKICCMISIKNGCKIKKLNPNSEVYILEQDVVTYGIEYENYYQQALSLGIKFIKYEKETPPKVGKRFVKLKDVRGRRLKISPEVVILTTPLIPSPSIPKLSNLFKVPLTGDGFFLEAHPKLNPIEFTTPGIYLCGSCSYPMDTIEAMTQAYGVGAKIGKIMKVGKVRSEPISGKIQNELCCNCLVCKEVCPGDAIEVEEGRVVVNSFKCKGCGLCVSVCRNKAMEQEGFGTREMVAMIGEML